MPLKDLAYSDKEAKEKYALMDAKYEGPKYPWGLSLRLDEHCLKKLGMDENDFTVGEFVTPAEVKFRVTGKNVNEQADGGRWVEINLTMVAADFGGGEGSSDAEKAEKLYGEKKA